MKRIVKRIMASSESRKRNSVKRSRKYYELRNKGLCVRCRKKSDYKVLCKKCTKDKDLHWKRKKYDKRTDGKKRAYSYELEPVED